MTDKTKNPRAFPNTRAEYGMTLRDYFAGQVITALNPTQFNEFRSDFNQKIIQEYAACAYKYADAMLKEREKFDE